MKTKFFTSFVVICIILSFFVTCCAKYVDEDNTYLTITGHNNKDHDATERDDKIVIQNFADGQVTQVFAQMSDSDIRITASQSGLYAVSVYKSNSWPIRETSNTPGTYTLKDTNGNFLCIPAKYEADTGKYTLYSNFISPNRGNTNTVIYLQAGEQIVLRFDSLGTSCAASIRYIPDGTEINGVKVDYSNTYLSGYSTRDRTQGSDTKTNSGSTNFKYYTGLPKIPNSTNPTSIRTPDDKPASALTKSEDKFELSVVSLMLTVGDFFVQLINDIVGEDVTITRLIFNQVRSVNVNFFDANARRGTFGGMAIGEAVNKWFQFFRVFAIMFYLIALLTIGIQVLLNSTAQGIQKAREFMSKWVKGIAMLFLMPLAMRYVFQLNEALVEMVQNANGFNDPATKAGVIQTGSSFSDSNVWSATEIEFRSPEFVSKYTGRVTFGTSEATKRYMKKINDYKQNLDLSNIMRAYVGATGILGYAIIWYVLIGQLIVFLFIYYKRFFIIAFLIAVFPVTCLFNAISIMQGKPGPQMSTWFKEFLTNVFTQFFHAIVYSVITGIIVDIVRESLTGGSAVTSGTVNWIIIIVAINFVPEGEKIIKKMIASLGSGKTGGDLSKSGKGLRGAASRSIGNIKQMAGIFKG